MAAPRQTPPLLSFFYPAIDQRSEFRLDDRDEKKGPAQLLPEYPVPTQTDREEKRTNNMLDVIDFIKERGGNPEAIRESQRRRFESVDVVDEVIALWEDHRKVSARSLLGDRGCISSRRSY